MSRKSSCFFVAFKGGGQQPIMTTLIFVNFKAVSGVMLNTIINRNTTINSLDRIRRKGSYERNTFVTTASIFDYDNLETSDELLQESFFHDIRSCPWITRADK